ncbi:hypothetical protein [Lewinella sp. LCG006]|uniref:hypothetical protein n=1 Tax=Lewinella sp. LCG006 TaxID=3231911 RepID=UPI00345FA909
MIRILLLLSVLFIAGTSLQAQESGEFEKPRNGPEKTWRDSGYYFIPTIVRFRVIGLAPAGSGQAAADVVFSSTENSDLMFNGQATIIFIPANLPSEINFGMQTRGLATILLPQDLLFCPDDEGEQGMGQDDPYFPLFLAGQFERINGQWLTPSLWVGVQLNDFVVN